MHGKVLIISGVLFSAVIFTAIKVFEAIDKAYDSGYKAGYNDGDCNIAPKNNTKDPDPLFTEDTDDEFMNGYKKGLKDGFKDGYDAGYSDGNLDGLDGIDENGKSKSA